MTSPRSFGLQLLDCRLAICQLAPDAEPPSRHPNDRFFALTWCENELTVICDAERAPQGARTQGGYRALMVEGPLDFGLTGVLAGLTDALAGADVPVFAVSTFDTDYLLVRERHLDTAMAALRRAGYRLLSPH